VISHGVINLSADKTAYGRGSQSPSPTRGFNEGAELRKRTV